MSAVLTPVGYLDPRALVGLLSDPSITVVRNATFALSGIVHTSNEHAKQVGALENAIPKLVSLLRVKSTCPITSETTVYAARTLRYITFSSERNMHRIIWADAIPKLVRLINFQPPGAYTITDVLCILGCMASNSRVHARRIGVTEDVTYKLTELLRNAPILNNSIISSTLQLLAHIAAISKESAKRIAAINGLISNLINLFQNALTTPTPVIMEETLMLLAFVIASCEKNAKLIANYEGIIPNLLELLNDPTRSDLAKRDALWAIMNIVNSSKENASRVITAGVVIPHIVNLLGGSPQVESVLVATLKALRMIISLEEYTGEITAQGATPKLVSLLNHESYSIKEITTSSLIYLTDGITNEVDETVFINTVFTLVKLLDSRLDAIRVNAASILRNIIANSKNRADWVVKTSVIPKLLGVLDTVSSLDLKNNVVSALAHSAKENLKQVVEEGVVLKLLSILYAQTPKRLKANIIFALSAIAQSSVEDVGQYTALKAAIPALVKLLSPYAKLVDNTKTALRTLITIFDFSDTTTKNMISKESIPKLISISLKTQSVSLRTLATSALPHIIYNFKVAEYAVSIGIIPKLAMLLNHRLNHTELKKSSALTLKNIVLRYEENHREIPDDSIESIIPPLVTLLGNESTELRMSALDALRALFTNSEKYTAVVVGAGVIPKIIALLHSTLLDANTPKVINDLKLILSRSLDYAKLAAEHDAFPKLVALSFNQSKAINTAANEAIAAAYRYRPLQPLINLLVNDDTKAKLSAQQMPAAASTEAAAAEPPRTTTGKRKRGDDEAAASAAPAAAAASASVPATSATPMKRARGTSPPSEAVSATGSHDRPSPDTRPES